MLRCRVAPVQWRQNPLQAQWVWSSTSAIICSISRPKAEEQTSWRPAAAQRAPPGASRGQSSRCAAHDDRGTVLSETPTSSAAMPPDPAGPRRRRPAAGGACSGRTALNGGMCLAQGHAGRRSWGTAAPTASQVGGGAGLRLRPSSASGQSSGTCVATAHLCRLPSESYATGWGNSEVQIYTDRPENVRIEAVGQPDGSRRHCLVVQAAFHPGAPEGQVCGRPCCCPGLLPCLWFLDRRGAATLNSQHGMLPLACALPGSKGCLQLHCNAVAHPATPTPLHVQRYASARLRTAGRFGIAPSQQWPCIRIEVRLRVTPGRGLWPAVWCVCAAWAQ